MSASILLVDDEANILKALVRLFHRHNIRVDTASSGQEALSLLHSNHYQVVVTDFRMPVMSGAELLERIKASSPDTVCLVLSGYADFDSVTTLLNAGTAYKFLQKPWEDDKLIEQVTSALDQYKKRSFEKKVHYLFERSADGLCEIDNDNKIIRCNAVFQKYIAEAYPGAQLDTLFVLAKDDTLDKLFESTDTFWCQRLDNKDIQISLLLIGSASKVISIKPDSLITINHDEANVKEELGFKSLIDKIDQHVQCEKPFSLAAIKLKNLSRMSKLYGFSDVKKMLHQIFDELISKSPNGQMVSYLSNDNFVLFIESMLEEITLHERLEQTVSSISKLAESYRMPSEFSVSYYMYPEHKEDSRALLNNLLLTNEIAAENSRNQFIKYDADALAQKRYLIGLERALLEDNLTQQLSLNFQPQYDVNNHKLSGCEALLRWEHPKMGNVSPVLFIPLAEEQGNIIEIGHWVMETVMANTVRWQAKGLSVGIVSLNVSGKQIMEADFIDRVSALVRKYSIQQDWVEFELTESFLIENMDEVRDKIVQLANMGIGTAIDDFGTGYSSLASLNRLPVNVLKLDRSLIVDVDTNISSQHIVTNIVRLAHDLNLRVVVEGIETSEQFEFVCQSGCDVIQGFFIAKPQNEESFLVTMNKALFTPPTKNLRSE